MIEHKFAYRVSEENEMFCGTVMTLKITLGKVLTDDEYAEKSIEFVTRIVKELGIEHDQVIPIPLSQINDYIDVEEESEDS